MKSKKPKKKELCTFCGRSVPKSQNVLFVEEEIGRIFCKEECILNYFTPEITKLESEYFLQVTSYDLSGDEKETLSHLRWVTLQEPDEIWCQKKPRGDHRYIFISEFQPGQKQIWCVCICLLLNGKPSFLFLSFPTSDPELVDRYRKGKKMSGHIFRQKSAGKSEFTPEPPLGLTDGLADDWTEDETVRAVLKKERRLNDISSKHFHLYEDHLEETLKTPDEVWSLKLSHRRAFYLYHFIRHYPGQKEEFWYIVVAKETEDREQIEILDAFPTRHSKLVECYRKGKQELAPTSTPPLMRMVH